MLITYPSVWQQCRGRRGGGGWSKRVKILKIQTVLLLMNLVLFYLYECTEMINNYARRFLRYIDFERRPRKCKKKIKI